MHKELDLCRVYLHAVQAAAVSHDLSQGLTAQGAALQGLPLGLLQTHFSKLYLLSDAQHQPVEQAVIPSVATQVDSF